MCPGILAFFKYFHKNELQFFGNLNKSMCKSVSNYYIQKFGHVEACG